MGSHRDDARVAREDKQAQFDAVHARVCVPVVDEESGQVLHDAPCRCLDARRGEAF